MPLLSPDWPSLAAYTSGRNAHFGQLGAGIDAVYDAATNLVTLTSPVSGSLTATGVATAGSTSYGSDVSAPIALTANVAVSVSGRRLP